MSAPTLDIAVLQNVLEEDCAGNALQNKAMATALTPCSLTCLLHSRLSIQPRLALSAAHIPEQSNP